MTTTSYVFLCGLFFGLLQFSFFFVLVVNLSSSGLTYLTTTCGWLLGVSGGLSLPVKRRSMERDLVLLALALYYAHMALVYLHRYDNRFLPLYVVLIAGGALYGGYFFKANETRFKRAKHIFFWENNGFIACVIGSFLGVSLMGEPFLKHWPWILGIVLLAFQAFIDRGDKMERDLEISLSRFLKVD